ncbi:MAG: hypothetical protein HYY95_13265 [Candidatus Rokubacteria bacterium]|nr:hypothetical protein [Candidatus Rokubacteria bacterium]
MTRAHHPFEGRALTVLSWTHRGGQLQLVLVLPDGSRALIPAAWTDLHDGSAAADPAPRVTLARLGDLLQARTVVDALLRRLPMPGEAQPSPPDAEEDHRANAPDLSRRARPRGPRVGRPGGRPTRRRDRRLGAAGRESRRGPRPRGATR